MAQISKGDTFVDGQQVTGSRLNQLVDSAQLLVGAITDQASMTANTLEATDAILVSDAGVLKKATVGDVLNSQLSSTFNVVSANSVTPDNINGKTNKDINMTPNDGVLVTGKSFTSVDGITAVVTSVAHGLQSNMLLEFTASNSAYSGLHPITVLSVDTFSYVIVQTTPVAASGTLSYTKKGAVKVTGGLSVTSEINAGGDINTNGNVNVIGTVRTANLTSTGTANFTGTLQVNGSTAYALYEVYEETMTAWTAPSSGFQSAIWTSSSFTKPSDEIWEIQLDGTYEGVDGYTHEYGFRYGSTTARSGQYLAYGFTYSSGVTNAETKWFSHSWVIPAGTALTSQTLTVDASSVAGASMKMFQTTIASSGIISTFGGTIAPSKFKIYKYKTA